MGRQFLLERADRRHPLAHGVMRGVADVDAKHVSARGEQRGDGPVSAEAGPSVAMILIGGDVTGFCHGVPPLGFALRRRPFDARLAPKTPRRLTAQTMLRRGGRRRVP